MEGNKQQCMGILFLLKNQEKKIEEIRKLDDDKREELRKIEEAEAEEREKEEAIRQAKIQGMTLVPFLRSSPPPAPHILFFLVFCELRKLRNRSAKIQGPVTSFFLLLFSLPPLTPSPPSPPFVFFLISFVYSFSFWLF